ncbi:UNVERIFIED_ORG: membrane protease YdiL (CAAX protease family) [Arthrobacter sp. UYCu721]
MPNPNNTLRGWFTSLAVVVGALALYLSAAIIATLLSGSPMTGAVVSNAVLFTAGLLWLHSNRHQGGSEIPVRRHGGLSRGPGFWALVSITLVFCWLVGQAAAMWLYGLVGSSDFDAHAATKAEAPVLLMLLVVMVLAPMGEEMLMRGVAYSRMRRHMPPLAAAVLSTGLFSLMHLNLVQIMVTLPLGILLAIVYEKTGRLTPVILLHAVFNLLSVVVPAALVSALSSLTFVSLGGAVLALLLVRLYRPVLSTAAPGSELSGVGSSGLTGTRP